MSVKDKADSFMFGMYKGVRFIAWAALNLMLWAIAVLFINSSTFWIGAIIAVVMLVFSRMTYLSFGLDGLFNFSSGGGGLHDVHENASFLAGLVKPFKQPDARPGIVIPGAIPVKNSMKPLQMSAMTFAMNHVAISGASGTGKSKLAAKLITDLHKSGIAQIIFDPKDDATLQNVLINHCKKVDTAFHFFNLDEAVPQFDPLAGCSRQEAEQLLQAALNLDPTGDAAVDFHRQKDREALSLLLVDGVAPLPQLVARGKEIKAVTGAEGLWGPLKMLAAVPAFHTDTQFMFDQAIDDGSMIYVIGNSQDLTITSAHKMVLTRVLQVIKKRKSDEQRKVTLFMDEFKYLLSNTAMRALGTVRDRGCNLILAFQSFDDLEDCPGLNPKAVKGAVQGNASINFVYKTTVRTAKEFVEMSGKERISVESSDKLLKDGLQGGAWREADRDAVTVDMLTTNLPKPLPGEASVCFVFGLGPAFPLATMALPKGPLMPEILEVEGLPQEVKKAAVEPSKSEDVI